MSLSHEKPNLRELIVEWMPAIRRVASSYVSNEEKEDLAQDILLALWESLPGFREESTMRTFVYRIAHNRSIDFIRKRSHQPVTVSDDDLVSREPAADRVAEARCRKERLVAAIRTLDLKYRQPLTMSLDGLSHREIGEILNLSENNIGVRIHRARQALQDTLNEQEKS